MRSRVVMVIGVVLLLTSAACGENGGSKPRATTQTSVAAGPRVDPGTKAEAQKVLDQALDRQIAANRGHYRSIVDLGEAGAIFAEGRFDIKAKSGVWRLVQPALGRDGAENDEFAMRGMAIDRHVYGGPEFGPFQKCWFDYGTGVSAFQGIGEQENRRPWYPSALTVASEARALGFINGSSNVIAVEIFADSALAVLFTKMLRKISGQLPEEDVWTKATLSLHDGTYSRLTFQVGDALDALEDVGVDLGSQMNASERELLSTGTQTTTYDQLGDTAPIKAPRADELIDATGITPEDPSDPEPCAAAR